MTGTLCLGNARRCLAATGVSVILGALMVRRLQIIALVVPATLGVMALVLAVRCLVTPDDSGHQRRILWWTLVAFAGHLGVGLIITNSSALVAYLGGDALGYHRVAVQLLQHWRIGLPAPALPSGKHGFYYVLAGVYWVFGPYTSVGLVLNAALAAALVPLLSEITERLFGRAATRSVPFLAVMLPGLFLWTSQLLKESAVLFLFVVALYCAVRLTEHITLGSLSGLAGAMAIGFTMRAFVALVFAGGLMAGIAFGRKELLAGFGTGIGAVFALAVLVLSFGLGYSGYKTATSETLAHASLVHQDSGTAASGFGAEVDISTPNRALSYLPKGMLSVGLGPFPWEIGGPRQLPALVDVLVWWALLPSLWRGHRVAWRIAGRRVLVLVCPAAITVALLALSVANYGTVVRERTQVVVAVIPLIALGLSHRASRRSPTPDAPAVTQPA